MKKVLLTVTNPLKGLALALLATVWLTGCSDDEESDNSPLTRNASEFVQDEDQLSTLNEALEQAGLGDVLADGSTEVTVFAPNDSAFASYLQANPNVTTLSEIPDEVLSDVLKYHVVPGARLAADLTTGSLSTLLDGESIAVTEDNGIVLNGSTRIVTPDRQVSNGVIHVVDAVLRTAAEEESKETIAEIATATDDLSILVSALQRTPDLLAAAADSTVSLTVFAPSNEAFANFLEEDDRFDDLASIPDEVLTQVLQYHILASAKKAADLGESEETLNGEAITIAKTDDGVFINETTQVATADIEASNGVVHLIDEVLVPPSLQPQPTIAGLAIATDDLSTLVAALQRAPDLLAADDDTASNLTVFAPTNEAFAAFLESDPRFNSIDDIPDEVLTQVLQYHILASKKLGADLEENEETLSGESLSIDKTDGLVINGSVKVTAADIEAANGVVHLIDQVLLPPSLAPASTIAQIAIDTEALSTLVAALQRTPDLLETASNPAADITVFAPTNDAFGALLTALGVESLDDVPDYVLRQVLEYHILASGKLAADLQNDEETLEGATLDIDKTDGVVINGNTNVIADLANIEAANGVVHVIDQVLVPPFIASALGTALQPLLFDGEERFTTLLAAIESQEGVFDLLTRPNVDGTLFAPTNTAFEELVAESDAFSSLEEVLAAENLADILFYHIGAVRRTSQNLQATSGATHSRLENPNTGEPLEIYYSNTDDGLVLIGYSNVTEADIATPNEAFIMHAIDAVLLPPSQSVAGIVSDNPQFSQLVAALTRVENESGNSSALLPLVSILSKERGVNQPAGDVPAPFTVFAPTDAAFEALYDALGVDGVNAIDIETLQNVLLYHVISGEPVFSTDLASGEVATIGGTFTVDADNLTITDGSDAGTDATIVITNVLGTNGVVHAIDQVLLPE